MSDVVFKDLCLDAQDAGALARFWAPVLGLEARPRNATWLLTDGVPEHTVWVNSVPEPKTVKNRVHLDVHVPDVAGLERAGARVIDDQLPWTVLADPEGHEFCAFVRPPERLPSYRLSELVVDAVDPQRIASWWAERLGAVARSGEPGTWWLPPVSGLPWELIFTAVPEAKIGKNRVHWDVWGDTGSLLAAGATVLRSRDAEISWDVLADPEGNEFCVFTSG